MILLFIILLIVLPRNIMNMQEKCKKFKQQHNNLALTFHYVLVSILVLIYRSRNPDYPDCPKNSNNQTIQTKSTYPVSPIMYIRVPPMKAPTIPRTT